VGLFDTVTAEVLFRQGGPRPALRALRNGSVSRNSTQLIVPAQMEAR
jgi:hypothetical protein